MRHSIVIRDELIGKPELVIYELDQPESHKVVTVPMTADALLNLATSCLLAMRYLK